MVIVPNILFVIINMQRKQMLCIAFQCKKNTIELYDGTIYKYPQKINNKICKLYFWKFMCSKDCL